MKGLVCGPGEISRVVYFVVTVATGGQILSVGPWALYFRPSELRSSWL